GEVAPLLSGAADLLGIQAHVVGVGEHLLERQPRLVQAPGAGERLTCAEHDADPRSWTPAPSRRSGRANSSRLSRRGDALVIPDSADDHGRHAYAFASPAGSALPHAPGEWLTRAQLGQASSSPTTRSTSTVAGSRAGNTGHLRGPSPGGRAINS